MDGNRFDQLSRFLGRGVHRRAAVAALAALAVGGVGEATARHKHKQHGRAAGGNANGGNSACDVFCHTFFGDTQAAGECTSDAAHGTGLCVTCGAANANKVCCANNSAGFCPDYKAASCSCPSGQTCQTGTCQCPAAKTNCNGACVNLQTDPNSLPCSNGRCCMPDGAECVRNIENGVVVGIGTCACCCRGSVSSCNSDSTCVCGGPLP